MTAVDAPRCERRPRVHERHAREGRGSSLTLAFEAVEAFPVLAEARDRLLGSVKEGCVKAPEAIAAVESDVGLTIAVMGLANGRAGGTRSVDTVAGAMGRLSPVTVRALAGRLCSFNFFEQAGAWALVPERFRLHALATQRAADWIASVVGHSARGRLAVASLLHDVGKLVMIQGYPGQCISLGGRAETPERRLAHERAALGLDHALLGGIFVERIGLPQTLFDAIARHHAEDAEGDAAIIRLADMLAHYDQAAPVSGGQILCSARAVGLGSSDLRRLMLELPCDSAQPRREPSSCPLTGQELRVLQQLANGKVYKEIAHDLDLSVSTIRTHLHNIYTKIGVADRAQAVLMASESGWV
jgi:DNA-binding CsgD family transcriptional regulator/HD-like signal output (HDOD) protein